MTDPGAKLRQNNDKIVHFIQTLKEQRAEIANLIEKQEVEKKKLEVEIERCTYKISLVSTQFFLQLH